MCRFGPMFLFNSAFKLGSIALILAMLRFNAIWLYGGIVIIWLLLQFLFNENLLPRRFYYLFIGAGLHAVSVAHIQEEVRLINTNPDSKKNILYATRLTHIQLKANMWFQNIIWFLLNSVIIITLTVVAEYMEDTKVPLFWPFNYFGSYTFTTCYTSTSCYHGLTTITPAIVCLGVISLILLFFKEFKPDDREKLINPMKFRDVGNSIYTRTKRQSAKSTESNAKRSTASSRPIDLSEFPCFKHDPSKCGCDVQKLTWHLYESDNDAEVRIVTGNQQDA